MGTSPAMKNRQPQQAAPPTRVVISQVEPTVEGGLYPAKRVIGDILDVSATICADGHDIIAARVAHRVRNREWQYTPMTVLPNDRYVAAVEMAHVGTLEFVVEAWIDVEATWRRRIERRSAAGLSVDLDIEDAARAVAAGPPQATRSMSRSVVVDRELAGFSAWYEFFPRSTVDGTERHGTLRDACSRLPEIAALGLRHRIPAADPPDRPTAAQGAQQQPPVVTDRCGQSVGDR